jgi:predicted nucleic acid-binding protein
MANVFLDTAGLFALINKDDVHHAHTLTVMKQLDAQKARPVTSDWVLTELLGLATRKRQRRAASALVRDLVENPDTRIIAATRAGWRQAFDLYLSRADKEWSLVDCSSILICQDLRITSVLTSDRHFIQAGFDALLIQ